MEKHNSGVPKLLAESLTCRAVYLLGWETERVMTATPMAQIFQWQARGDANDGGWCESINSVAIRISNPILYLLLHSVVILNLCGLNHQINIICLGVFTFVFIYFKHFLTFCLFVFSNSCYIYGKVVKMYIFHLAQPSLAACKEWVHWCSRIIYEALHLSITDYNLGAMRVCRLNNE